MNRTLQIQGGHARIVALLACLGLVVVEAAWSQPPTPAPGPGTARQFPVDPRVQTRTYRFEDTNEDLQYSLFVSSKVEKNGKAPLVVSLHGLGVDHGFMLRGNALDLAEQGGFILVGPEGYNARGWYGVPQGQRFFAGARPPAPPGAAQTPSTTSGSPAQAPRPPAGGRFGPQPNDPPNMRELSEKDVLNVLALVRKEFNVDDKRIYLMGHSMGGAGTLHLAVKYPDLWAAVGAMAPAAFELDPQSIAKIPRMPVIIVHGDADMLVPIALSRAWADVMKQNGMDYAYDELPGVDHGVVITQGTPLIYDFFAKHKSRATGEQ
jgi:poly(3-hydroxybutyrate) depolymerase